MTQHSADKLKPCPFCGMTDSIIVGEPRAGNYNAHCQPFYDGCGASTGERSSKGIAIAAWNTRAPDASDEEG